MLVNDVDLSLFQTCPRRCQFNRQSVQQEHSLQSLQQAIAVWMWTYQIIHGSKCSLRALKEKWSKLVTNSQIKTVDSIAPIAPIGDLIAVGFPIVRTLYDEYLDSKYQPAATMLPLRLTLEHVGVIQTVINLVVLDELQNTVIINYIEDSSNHHVLTNLTYKTQLLAASKQLNATQLINIKLTDKLSRTHIYSHTLETAKLETNLEHIVKSIKAGIDYPILNCKLQCPFKDKCL